MALFPSLDCSLFENLLELLQSLKGAAMAGKLRRGHLEIGLSVLFLTQLYREIGVLEPRQHHALENTNCFRCRGLK